jgi:hypothetical protein
MGENRGLSLYPRWSFVLSGPRADDPAGKNRKHRLARSLDSYGIDTLGLTFHPIEISPVLCHSRTGLPVRHPSTQLDSRTRPDGGLRQGGRVITE